MPDILLKTENRRYIRSSSFVMALVFTILCALAALSLGYFIHYFAKGHFVHSTESFLDAEIRYIEAVGADQVKRKDQLHLFLNTDGTLPDIIPNDLTRLAEGILVFDIPENGQRYAAKIHTLADDRKILVGKNITAISKDFKFMQWLGIASIFFVVLIMIFAYLISIFVVSGTNKIAHTAREIMDTGDLSRRLTVTSRWDDLGHMSLVLNMLLDRVEELMHGVRQVSDNIAHDLRTPLTRLQSKLEGLKDSPQKDELLDEADHLLSTFNALLRISRIEAEQKRSQFDDVNLKTLLEDVVAFYEPLAEDENITFASDLSEGTFHGDRDLLFQAFANLLDNAVKFTPAGGHVKIALRHNNGRMRIDICDTGVGVPTAEHDKIFNRFYRTEKSRSSTGTGLGLSLVNAVINLHGGNLEVENANPGLRIITIL